ncbi:hypothetical protein H0H93_011713 [Arthromyces matolae]|nr:hypothetical protein H0H93_011713 [Arthromyces matolae]
MSDWIDVKTEDSRPHFPDLSGTDPSIYLPPIEPPISATQNVSLLPETEQVIRSHSRPAATPSERQRTVQACDKCRERKTKKWSAVPSDTPFSLPAIGPTNFPVKGYAPSPESFYLDRFAGWYFDQEHA